MEHAHCTTDDRIWEAQEFADLPDQELEKKRRNLICVECNEYAWFRKESSHGHPAHFCAHHSEDCKLQVQYIVVDDPTNEETTEGDQQKSGDAIIVHLDEEQGGQIDVAEIEDPENPGQGQSTRTHHVPGQIRETFLHYTLGRLLYSLVRSRVFRDSNTKVIFFRNEKDVLIEGEIRNVVISFEDIDPDVHGDKLNLYWGVISSAGKTDDGKIWLNSSDHNGAVSIAIFEDVADSFLEAFNITDIDTLTGVHVLTIGYCRIAGKSGKPIIWCPSPKNIMVRRYRDPRLKA